MKRLLPTILSIGVVLVSGWLATQNNTVEVSADVQREPAAPKNWQISPISVTVENLPDRDEKNADSLGQVYFILGSFDRDLSKYQLVRLPGQCVIGEIECPQPEEIQTPFNPKDIEALDWSPEGKKAIAIETPSEEVEWGMRQVPPSRIHIFDAEEESWTKIYESSEYVLNGGKWSPDGKWISFLQNEIMTEVGHRITSTLFVIRPDGSETKMLFDPATTTGLFAWSGENLLMYAPDHPYDSTKDDLNTYAQNMIVHSINPETGETTVLFKPDRFAILHPSPNGSYLAFADQQSDRNPTPIKEIRLFDPSGNLLQSLGSYSNQYTGIYPVCWSPDSSLIAFGNFGKMYIAKPGDQPIEVYQADDSHVQPGIYSAVFSPDGSHLLMDVYDGRPKFVVVSADGDKQNEVTWAGQQEAEIQGLIQQPGSPSWRPIVSP